MDVQLNLFSTDDEATLALATTWLQLPEPARADVCNLFAALAIKHLRSTMGRSESDESQPED